MKLDLFNIRTALSFVLTTCVLLLLGVIENTEANNSGNSDVWSGRLSCNGESIIKNRGVIVRREGEKVWLTNFGKSGETYQSKVVKTKAKFKGGYKGFHNGEPFHKNIKVTVKFLDSGNVKVSGARGSRSHCYGELTKNYKTEKSSKELYAESIEKLGKYPENLLGQWNGSSGGLISRGKETSAFFKKDGHMIVGEIQIGVCLPKIKLKILLGNESVTILGEENYRSFRARITPTFGYVNQHDLYIPYDSVSDVSECPKKEKGFLRLRKSTE